MRRLENGIWISRKLSWDCEKLKINVLKQSLTMGGKRQDVKTALLALPPWAAVWVFWQGRSAVSCRSNLLRAIASSRCPRLWLERAGETHLWPWPHHQGVLITVNCCSHETPRRASPASRIQGLAQSDAAALCGLIWISPVTWSPGAHQEEAGGMDNHNNSYGRSNNGSQRDPHPYPYILWTFTYVAKGTLQVLIKLRILRCRD